MSAVQDSGQVDSASTIFGAEGPGPQAGVPVAPSPHGYVKISDPPHVDVLEQPPFRPASQSSKRELDAAQAEADARWPKQNRWPS